MGPTGPSSTTASDKEGKRTLTDFRIIGFGFVCDELTWSWGATRSINDQAVFPKSNNDATSTYAADSAVKEEEVSDPSLKDKAKRGAKETARIRIYFQPSQGVIPRDDQYTMPPPNSLPSRTSAKRKKSESEEDDVERGNAKRHHADEPRSKSIEMLAPLPSNGTQDASAADSEADTKPIAHDNEQASEFSTENDWLGVALHEEDGEGDEEEGDEVEEGEAEDLVEEIDDEAGLFGSGHPSPPTVDGGNELIVQPIDEPSQEDGKHSSAHHERNGRDNPTARHEHNIQSASSSAPLGGHSSGAGGPGGAGNKLSISFSSSKRRLVLEVEVVQYLKVFRAEGRVEFSAAVEMVPSTKENGSEPSIKGVCVRILFSA
jgi:20S proteasome subunit alpha 6